MLGRLGMMGRGSAAAFDPTNISGLYAWFDASVAASVLNSSDAQASNGETVKTWSDQANSYDLTQGTDANRPVLRTSSTNFSGSSLYFTDAVAYNRLLQSTAMAITAPYTIAIAWGPIAGGAAGSYVYMPDGSAIFYEQTDGNYGMFALGGAVLPSAYADDTGYSTVNVWNSSSSKHYKNSTLIGTDDPGDRDFSLFSLGASVGNANPARIEVAEILIYDGAMSNANALALSAYLEAKHGIS